MKIQTVWQVSKTVLFKENAIPGFSRITDTLRYKLVMCEQDILATELKDIYVRIKRNGFNCRSIKIFEDGELPDLSAFGFIKEQQWYVYPHERIDIAAVPFGKKQWCYLIEKRSGHGIPIQVFDVLPLFRDTTQISLWEEII